MYSTSNIYLDDCTAEHLHSFQPDPVHSNSDASSICVTPHQDGEDAKMIKGSDYYSGGEADSSFFSCSPVEVNTSRDSSTRRHPSPASSFCAHHDWNLSSGHQAKRARVENIIKGMTSSPGMHSTDVLTPQYEQTEHMKEDERNGELPLHQENVARSGISHSQRRPQHLRQLRTRFYHVDEVTTDNNKAEKYPTWNISPDTFPKDAFTDFDLEWQKYPSWRKGKLMNFFQPKPERVKLMADVLKHELSRAVSRSVDSVFKSVPLLQTAPHNEDVGIEKPLQSSLCEDKKIRLSCDGYAKVQIPDVQSEALSLVVQKPRLERCDQRIVQPRSRAPHNLKPHQSFSHDSALHDNWLLQKNHNTPRQQVLGSSEVVQANSEMFDTQWTSVKVKPKVNSRRARSPHTATVDPVLHGRLCFPRVKIESDSVVKHHPYMLNEGLTTNHLKKAKLMFFYTRYPSSLVLKTCFHDVQFTRCITSQLIKWFSNFREFYYIQMEKFARHALVEGVADVRDLTVGRESELFRALNMHYNKASDFQVPDRFVEVAGITLREFYVAISMGKDHDPSWKKAIYKVICKLDGDVPTEFKSHQSR
ncbi:prospero homeobox protein 1-like [Solea senegalensis]|uniref:Prospero homeobox protein 1-like n=2 Tax=Solea senegalensis TaxID=28829 RepID=A0AAV6RSL2_SOLSE|nr:prospero homeobox protein 1-like [Solea senegalensis]